MDLVLIAAAALVTAVLSAIAGLGGGVILLAVLAQFYAPVVAIPIHGGIQLVANGSRAYLLRGEIEWAAVWRAGVLMFPASMVGVLVATSIPEDATRVVLGVFVLVVAWRPSLLKWGRNNEMPANALFGVGALSGFLNTTVGVSGPVTSPMFRAFTASHAGFVATAAASQVLAHGAKVGSYFLDGFSLVDNMAVIGLGAAGVTVGSWIGSRLLGRISESQLSVIFRVVLTALALRLVVQAVFL